MSDRRVGKKISIFLSQEPALNPKKPEKIPENDFEGILKEAGFIIGKKNDSNELNVDQAIFLKDLNKKLSSKNSSELKDFITGFETHLEDEIRLKWSLMPTVTSASCETARSMSQDSLIHLLLNIEAIQEKVTEIMLSKLLEFSYCENNALYDRSENRTVACLIISQFRWLSRLVNSEAFAEKLLELIEATPIDVQRDILRLLPDVINEFDHPKVAKSLGGILLSNQDLKVIILDILTNLNVQPELLADIREKVIKTITTAEIEDLPVIVKFVLQDLSATEAPHIIQELRETLDFNSTFRPMVCSTPLVSKKKDMTKSVESCVLSIMKHAMEFQKCLTDAWIKQLEVLTGSQNHKSIDIFVILILLSLQNYEKKVESIIKIKIRAGDLNEDLLQSTFRCHYSVLQEYASIFLRVADSLLRASEPIISGFAKSIYIKCFVSFDAFNKQEVIGSLIIHVGSRSETEINAALDTLLLLVRNHTSKIVSYALFIKNLLDHLNELTLNQIRKVHEMLSILGYQGGREGSMLLDDMMIVIRKQLTNKNLKYRKMGVIGALMAAKVAAEKDAETSMDVSLSSESLDVDECYQHSIKLLELVADSTFESCEAYSLFCDELSHILLQKKLGQPILDWVGDKVLVDFEETYIIDIKPEDYAGKSFSPKYGLDEVNEPVAIDLYTIVKNDFSNLPQRILKPIHNEPSAKAKGKSCLNKSKVLEMLLKASYNQDSAGSSTIIPKSPSPLKLAPMFRLLRVFRQVQDDNLDSIDALLGCAIVLPELRYSKFGVLSTNEKHMILNVLFYCINWVRESINAFATANDRDIRCNVLSRLQLLVEMEGLVCKYLIETNGYTPPMANFDCDEKTLCALKLPTKKSAKRTVKSKKGSKKKSKKASSSEQTEETSLEGSPKSKSSGSEAEEFEAKQSTDVKLFKNLQPFFRELDMSVFTLLQCEITFQKRSDILENEKVTSLQMHPTELKFLLEDLSAKLNLCLSSTPAFWKGASQKHMGFSNLESYPTLKIVTYSVQLISPLCNVILEFAKFFRNLVTSADGVEDSLVLFADETQYNIVCFNLVLKVLKQIMSWKNFNLNENSSLLKKALTAFVLGEEVSENTPLKDLVKHCVKHLIKFANAVPSLSCASNLMELLVCISNYSEEHDSKAKISSLALAFLKKNWFDLDSKFAKSAEVNIHIRILLEAYLKTSASVLKALDFLSAEAIPQLMDQENEVIFHSLNKTSFGAYYKIMMSSLASYLKVYFATKHSDQEQMFEWSVAFKVFQVFTNLLKTFGSRSNIAACLKSSREFLHTFLKFGMPLMDKLFVENKEDVICLMKILQASTRYLQHVCCHSKVLKDVSLIQHVPFLKKSLEVFLFRVKMMLAVNKCEDAFWLGNLKNRDLKGEEILSQSLNDDNSEAEEREEEEENKSEVELSDAESEV